MAAEFYADYDRLIRLACPCYDDCLNLIARNIPPDVKTALDLGSGTGNLIISILDKHPNLKISGIELQPNLVKIANKKFLGIGRSDVEIIEGDILNCNWPKSEVITSSLTIHHFDYEQKKRLFAKVFRNSNIFLYFDRVKGESKRQEEKDSNYLFDYMRRNGLPEDFIQKATEEMTKNDFPLTLKEQNKLFEDVGFDYDLLYLKHGFAVYSCIRKE